MVEEKKWRGSELELKTAGGFHLLSSVYVDEHFKWSTSDGGLDAWEAEDGDWVVVADNKVRWATIK